MHDWFCQIELIEPIWQKKVEFKKNPNVYWSIDDEFVWDLLK